MVESQAGGEAPSPHPRTRGEGANCHLIHADRHGAVVVPSEKIDAMQAALDGLIKHEARIIAAARAPGASVEPIKAAIRG